MASHRANSRHLAGLPGRLTRRLFTTFHSAPLPVSPATSRTPTAPPKRTQAAALPPARAAKPPYRSTALHYVKTAETGDSPRQRITGPSSGNTRKLAGLRCGLVMRWPPKLVWPLAGQANSSFLPPSSACPSRSQKPRPRAPRQEARRMRAMYPGCVRAVSFCSGYDARSCASGPPQN